MNTYTIIINSNDGLLLHAYQPKNANEAHGVARELSRDHHCTVEVFHTFMGGESFAAYRNGTHLYGLKGVAA